jgi:hypothetical protein
MNINDLLKEPVDNRVRGFSHGYNHQFGPVTLLADKEYVKGWNEGATLRLDEVRAQARRDRREKT